MPMFPDSGVPPSDAKNSLPDVNAAGCPELWYSTSRCQPRFDPAAANAMLAEQMNLIMRAEMQYDCVSLNHVERAARYLIQRGLTRAAVANGGPFDYAFALDPTMTRYNDAMTLTMIPAVTNQGAVKLNGDNLGFVELRRNDGGQLQFADIRAGVPFIMVYWAGHWFHVGLCASQVPIVAIGAVDVWIRTDGNDVTGDGSANTPGKAFRTINGAWARVGSRYAATPLFTINMRLGIPGDYEAGTIANFGGKVNLIGDQLNARAYRIFCSPPHPSSVFTLALHIMSMSALSLFGINMCITTAAPKIPIALKVDYPSSVYMQNCCFEVLTSNVNAQFVWIQGGTLNHNHKTEYFGAGTQIHQVINQSGGRFAVASAEVPTQQFYYDMHFRDAGHVVYSLGTMSFIGQDIVQVGCTGIKYNCIENSILNLYGENLPGDAAGLFSSGGQVTP